MATATVDKSTEKAEQAIIAPVAPVIIGDIGKRYYFSSQAHMGKLRGHITRFDYPHPEWDDLPDDPKKRAVARSQYQNWKRTWTEEEQALLRQAFLEHPGGQFEWNYVSGTSGDAGPARVGFVWYATDSDATAFVIRQDMRSGGDGQFITEIPQDTYLAVGDLAYANNDLARKLAFEQMEKTGQPIVPKKKAEAA